MLLPEPGVVGAIIRNRCPKTRRSDASLPFSNAASPLRIGT